MKAHPYYTLLILAAMLGSSVSQADEIKPQTQRNSRKPVTTPAAAARKLAPESAAKKTSQNPDTQTNSQTQLRSELGKLEQDEVKDALDDLRVRPEVADKIVKEVADPATSTPAKGRIAEIAGAAADLDLVAVDPKIRDAVVDAVSRSDNPKETADKEVGKAAIDEVFGKEVTKLVPAGKLGRTVFTSLIGISGALQNLGADADDPEVIDAVKEGAKLGVATPEAARIVMEKGAQKVLDKQGFTPAKPGESLNDRLGREAEEQKKLQAELDAKKAADAARAASKARAAAAAQQAAKARAGNIGSGAISQGAAGSTNAGRSVSSKVKVAVGGGTGSTSGAGTARTGTGTDASKSTGVGGSARMDNASSRLAAGSGGNSVAGQPTSGSAPTTNPGTPTGAPAAADSAPAASQPADTRNDTVTATIETPAAENASQVNNTGAASPGANSGGATPSPSNSSVSTGDFLVGSPGNQEAPGFKHYDTDNPNVGVGINYAADGTYTGVVTVVTKDAAGNIVSITETPISGTWGKDASGQPKPATQTMGETTDATPGQSSQSTASNDGQQSTENSDGQQDSSDDGKDDDDDDKDSDDDKNGEDPPPADETAADDASTETKTEESKEASTTPNPMDIGGGDPSQLAARTGGRIGNQEARRQQRGLDLARFGGAAGPNPEGKGGVPTLLTPEEKANAERALNMRKGAGVTNPNPLGKGSVVATDRDLKEMHLRGNGGAKGPTDKTAPAKPQDPRSPVGGSTPGLAPTGGTRLNASKSKAATVNRNLSGDRRIAEDALKSIIRN